METGILNFHDEEFFSTSFYEPGDMGSDQYSSDYLDASDSHWGTEQELNGDIAVLPMECPPRHMRALHNREDYHRAFDEWQEHLICLQPVGPDDMELHVDSHEFAADLASTVFQDTLSFSPEPLPPAPTDMLSSLPRAPPLSPIPTSPPCHSPTPSPLPTESILDESIAESKHLPVMGSPERISFVKRELKINNAELDDELDESILSLDISNIDEKALEELQCDIKGLANGAPVTSILGDFKVENGRGLLLPEDSGGIAGSQLDKRSIETSKICELSTKDKAIIIGVENIEQLDCKNEPLALDFNEIDSIEIKDELNLEIDSLGIDMDMLSEQMPVLEAGNLESLLEQFEATETGKSAETIEETISEPIANPDPVSPVKSRSVDSLLIQRIPSIKPQPIESVKPKAVSPVKPKPSVQTVAKKPARVKQEKAPSKTKQDKGSKPSVATNLSSQFHKDIRDALPTEVIDRIKACGRRKEIAIIPAIPNPQNRKPLSHCDSAPRNQRNKTNRKAPQTNPIQFDHDYCGSKESTPAPICPKFYNCDASEYTTATVVRSSNCKTTVQIQATTVRRAPDCITIIGNSTKKDRKPGKSLLKSSLDWYDEKSSRKDSGVSSGDVSDDSESAALLSGSSSGCETGGSTTIGKVQLANTSGKPKDLLMVSVLKKSSNLPEKRVTKMKITNATPIVPPKVTLVLAPVPAPAPVPEEQQPQPKLEVEEAHKPKKRKLNLDEYRSRQKELERQRSGNEKSGSPDTVDVDSATAVSVPEPAAPETKGNGNRCAAGQIEKENPCETTSNIEARAQTTPTKESQSAVIQPTEKRRRQYRRRRSTSSSSASSVCIKQKQDVTSSKRETMQKWCRTESRSRSKSCSERQSRLRSSWISSDSSSSGSRSSSSSSRSCSGSSSSSRNYSRSSRSSRRSSRSRSGYHDSRSRRQDHDRSRSRSRNRSRSWRRRSRSGRREGRRSYCRSRSSSHSCSRSYSKRRRSSSSRSYSSDSSRSRSRNRSRSRSRSRSQRYRRSRSRGGRVDGGRDSRPSSRNWRSRSPVSRYSSWQFKETERNREIEERRVVYVGRIPEETTKAELRRRFEAFGPIVDISLHFRERADNYGFVTFAYKADAYSAVERGNDDPSLPRYDLCFGGRRKFCRERYADLDGIASKTSDSYQSPPIRPAEGNSFDLLLRQAQAKLRMKKV